MAIRQKLNTDGILRRLFEPLIVTPDELSSYVESSKWEKEPFATPPAFIPFEGISRLCRIAGAHFCVPVGKIEIENDILQSERSAKDIAQFFQYKEDKPFIETIDSLCEANPDEQLVKCSMAAGGFINAFVQGMNALLTLMHLPSGKVLMHENTFTESLKLKADEIGFGPQSMRFDKGWKNEDTFMGCKIIKTVKDDIVPEGVIYFFTEQERFCKFILHDVALQHEAKTDMSPLYEYIGVGISNTKGVVKLILE